MNTLIAEMIKLRKILDKKGIKWIDRSDISDNPSSKKFYDMSMYRTCFTHHDTNWVVINGFGSIGHKDGLLELITDCVNNGNALGNLRATDVIELVSLFK